MADVWFPQPNRLIADWDLLNKTFWYSGQHFRITDVSGDGTWVWYWPVGAPLPDLGEDRSAWPRMNRETAELMILGFAAKPVREWRPRRRPSEID